MKFAKESLNLMDSENYYSWFDRILAVIFFLSPLALFYWAYLIGSEKEHEFVQGSTWGGECAPWCRACKARREKEGESDES